MSNKSTSPIAYPRRPDNAVPPFEQRVARATKPPSAAILTTERIPPACETCAGLRLATEGLKKLRQRLKEKELESERIIQEKSELLGTAAHDLRLPLSTIRICTELLAEAVDEKESGPHKELIESIHFASGFMMRLLDDTLDLATVESGVLQLHATPETLGTILAKTVAMSLPLAARKGIRLTLRDHGEPLPVLVDQIKLSKVFNNLIENAIKFCQPGARIEVRISGGADTVLVAVEDDGPGIDARDLQTLFTPFQRTRARALSDQPGAGLGLAVAKRMVELHSGQIWVKSKVGKGTTFYVSLPALAYPPQKNPEPETGHGHLQERGRVYSTLP